MKEVIEGQTEAELQKECNKYLNEKGLLYFHIEKGRHTNKTHRKGWPDLFVFGQEELKGHLFPKTVFVELKRQGGSMNLDQKRMFLDLDGLKFPTYLCDSIEKFKAIMLVEFNI